MGEMRLLQWFGVTLATAAILTGLPSRADRSPGRSGNPLDQGGETCAAATVIASLPYADTGTTTGYFNDYDYPCPYPGSPSPDVVYSYTPSAYEQVTLSLCGGITDYDTKLFVYAGSCIGQPIACNDNACSSPQFADYVSQLDCVPLAAGVTYYIVVDGYGGQSGNYTLNAYVGCTCPIECPPGSVMENEPVCADEYVDEDNGGCGSNPVVWDTLACDQTVCATTGTFLYSGSESRDTDWYIVQLASPSDLTWTVHGDYPIASIILQAGTPEPCEGFTMVAFASGPCSTVVTANALDTGLYFLWTAPSVFTDVPCGTLYWGQVTCRPNLDAVNDLTIHADYADGNDLVLRWSAVPFATFYRIYTSPIPGEPWTLLDSTTFTTYTHVGALDPRLFYDVRACSP